MAAPRKAKRTARRGRPRAARLLQPDHPYTMKLPDGRTVYVEVPGRWVTMDRGGEVAFLPDAVAFLDQIRVLAMRLERSPSPGYIATLRAALGLTQAQLGARIGVDKLSVSRWERGAVRPGRAALERLEQLRRQAVRKGVVVAG